MSAKKIGYALGGGAARGLSHIGVLKVLREYGIYPDVIAGTSIGAIIGALYAGGYDPDDMEKIVLGLDWKKLLHMVDMTIPLSGLLQGKRVVSLLRSILGDITFSELRCGFSCLATDIISGEQVVLHDGSLIEAVRASISIPGIFTPVELSGRYLVDGGLVNTVPVSICREMGADYVIGVNVIPEPIKLMYNSNKILQSQVCELINSAATGKEDIPTSTPKIGRRSLQSHINDIENATDMFLISHRLKRKTNTPCISPSKRQMTSPSQKKAPKLIDILSQSLTISEYRLAVENLKEADLAISPDVEEIGFWQFNNAERAIELGEQAAHKVLDKKRR
jgi:NTE family protein